MNRETNFTQTVDMAMQAMRELHKQNLSKSHISQISTSHCYYNTLNLAIGRQGSGKSDTLMREIIKISNVSDNTHLLIYSNKTGNETDDTFESLKQLIGVPIVYIAHDDLEDYLKDLLKYKEFYQRLIKENLYDKIIDEQRDEIFSKLHINDFSRPFLHTLIMLDDVAQAKILKNERTYIQEMMTQCRHIKCSFFLAVQYLKSLTTNIRSAASTIFIFGNFTKPDFDRIYSYFGPAIEKEELWKRYSQLKKHDKIIIDRVANTVL
jgi:hypothetical protein